MIKRVKVQYHSMDCPYCNKPLDASIIDVEWDGIEKTDVLRICSSVRICDEIKRRELYLYKLPGIQVTDSDVETTKGVKESKS